MKKCSGVKSHGFLHQFAKRQRMGEWKWSERHTSGMACPRCFVFHANVNFQWVFVSHFSQGACTPCEVLSTWDPDWSQKHSITEPLHDEKQGRRHLHHGGLLMALSMSNVWNTLLLSFGIGGEQGNPAECHGSPQVSLVSVSTGGGSCDWSGDDVLVTTTFSLSSEITLPQHSFEK